MFAGTSEGHKHIKTIQPRLDITLLVSTSLHNVGLTV